MYIYYIIVGILSNSTSNQLNCGKTDGKSSFDVLE